MKFPMVFVRHQYEKVTHEYAGLVKTLAGFLEFVQDHCTEFDDDLRSGSVCLNTFAWRKKVRL